jgi:hypothetical protein
MNNTAKICLSAFFCLVSVLQGKADGRDSLAVKGQLSVYSHYNASNELPWLNGGRYIPQLNYRHNLKNNRLIDFEVSANLFGNAALNPFDTIHLEGKIKPYRLWVRYSTDQLEIRAGLQKINFGSASILRPLMWFDKIDPRDPLKLTDGVWGILARYYFLNNANIWLWGLAANENLKGWETFKTSKDVPEFGGRLQLPVPHGEAGFSYHHREANIPLPGMTGSFSVSPENRFGIDAKFDMVIGWWLEASWSNFGEKAGVYSNQEIFNVGMDYTFGIGNGLTVIYEQLLASSDRNAFEFRNSTTFSLLNLTYPVGIFDNASAIVYYDWKNNKAYNFVTWQRQLNRFSLYLMGYINPRQYNIPTQNTDNMIYGGSGIQVMLVFNH